MIERREIINWSVFAFVALCYCLLLSLRPIPALIDENDTGRYVAELQRFCAGTAFDDLFNKELSYNIFYNATATSCLANSSGLFLFQVAAFLPMTFLLFSKWRKSTLIWASGLIFSVYGLELTTNAMRQGFGMFLFLGSLAIVDKYRIRGLALGALAALAHTSVLAFLPVLIWISCRNLTKKQLQLNLMAFAVVGGLWLYVNQNAFVEFVADTLELQDLYGTFYEDEIKRSFIFFMAMPLYFVHGMRLYYERDYVSDKEKISCIASTIIMAISLLLFQFITYRFAIFAVVMQIFLITLSSDSGSKVASRVSICLFAHLIFMIIVTKHFDVLVYG